MCDTHTLLQAVTVTVSFPSCDCLTGHYGCFPAAKPQHPSHHVKGASVQIWGAGWAERHCWPPPGDLSCAVFFISVSQTISEDDLLCFNLLSTDKQNIIKMNY